MPVSRNFYYVIIPLFSFVLLGGGCVYNIENNPSREDVPNTTSNTGVQADSALNLRGQGLSKVPSYVFDMKNLEELNLSDNNLTGALPGEIRQLQKLRILNASNNRMTGVPAEVGQLQNLEVLDLSNNELTGLPYELGNLQNLKRLILKGNNYSQQDLDIIKQKLPSGTVIE